MPDHLPGEPPPRVWTTWGTAGVLLQKIVALLAVATLSLPFWPLYLLLRLTKPRPPIFPSTTRTLRCLHLVFTEHPAPALTTAMRLGLALEVIRHSLSCGPLGCGWFLRCQATVPPSPTMDWNWIVPHALAVETEYCLNENSDSPRKSRKLCFHIISHDAVEPTVAP